MFLQSPILSFSRIIFLYVLVIHYILFVTLFTYFILYDMLLTSHEQLYLLTNQLMEVK